MTRTTHCVVLALAPALLLLSTPATFAAQPIPFTPELNEEAFRACQQVLVVGIFHPESLGCYPDMRRQVEKALCSVRLGDVWLPFSAGFGCGATTRPRSLPEGSLPLARAKVDTTAWNAWRAERCRDAEPTIDLEADWGVATRQPEATEVGLRAYRIQARTLEAFAEARAEAPPSLSEPWEGCARIVPYFADKTGVACRLVGSLEGKGADQTLYFTAQRILNEDSLGPLLLPIPLPRYFAPKLRHDLEILGAICEGPKWRKGMRVKGHHTLRCRRRGTAAVTFHLTTSKGDCTATLPALDELPDRTTCSEPDAIALPPVFPFW